MLKSVVFSYAADRDVEEIRAWYAEISPHLAQDFEESLAATLARVVHMPDSFPSCAGQYRRVVMNDFKYLVFFRVQNDKAIVSLVIHHKRNPIHWRTRLH